MKTVIVYQPRPNVVRLVETYDRSVVASLMRILKHTRWPFDMEVVDK